MKLWIALLVICVQATSDYGVVCLTVSIATVTVSTSPGSSIDVTVVTAVLVTLAVTS